jgi:hypothetical protein
MKNNYLKKNTSKKDEEIRKYKRRAKAFLILLIIIGAVLLIQFAQNFIQGLLDSKNSANYAIVNKSDLNATYWNVNSTNQTQTQVCEVPTLSKQIVSFMDRLFLYPSSFWTKFFIFLGIIYIIQIVFSLVFDIIELILLAFVAIKRFIKWIYRKITRKDSKGENFRKIEELYKDEKFK